MKKAMCVLLCFIIFCFAGCESKNTESKDSGSNTESTAQTVSEVRIKQCEDGTVNGYKTGNSQKSSAQSTSSSSTSSSSSAVLYFANTSSKKFHRFDCRYASSIKSNNLLKTNDRAKLISEGYKPCSNCNP